jgi:hypothetical protein
LRSDVNIGEEFTITCELYEESLSKVENGTMAFYDDGRLVPSQFVKVFWEAINCFHGNLILYQINSRKYLAQRL